MTGAPGARAYTRAMLRAAALLAATALLPALAACDGRGSAPTASAAPVTVAYDVGKMHCGGCAEAITAQVSAVKGVKGVACTIETRRAVIELADPAAQPEAEKAMTGLGYTITRVAPDAPLSAEAQAEAARKAAKAAQPADEPSSR